MPGEHPLLIFPKPSRHTRHDLKPDKRQKGYPGYERQSTRLNRSLEALRERYVERGDLRGDIAGSEPEQVLVLEIVGSVADFQNAVKKIPGLEWLNEWDEDSIEQDEDFFVKDRPEDQLQRSVYLVMSNQVGYSNLLAMWRQYIAQQGQPAYQHGLGRWKALFTQLRDIRPWGPEDRIRETGLYEEWKARQESDDDGDVPVEIELWFRNSVERRVGVESDVMQLVSDAGGRVLNRFVIEEIAYHSVLAFLPIGAVKQIVDHAAVGLVRCDNVMFFRPSGQSCRPPTAETDAGFSFGTLPDRVDPEPRIGLLDGLPMENHNALSSWLLVDDPEGWASQYDFSSRRHGTSMASLIIHGDLASPNDALPRRLYARPIMKPDIADFAIPPRESIPYETSFASSLMSAVERMMQVAPTIRIVNLSICDRYWVFSRYPTPAARALDYLSFKYGLLFLVSAGNETDRLEIAGDNRELQSLLDNKDALEDRVLQTVSNLAWARRLMTPSDSINSLTVGAVHAQAVAQTRLGRLVDPYVTPGLPSPINAQGPGFKKAIKPDVVFPGGRQQYLPTPYGIDGQGLTLPSSQRVGQRVAAPGSLPGETDAVAHSCGTSNATALATRAAGRVLELIESLTSAINPKPTSQQASALVKALVVHGASWNSEALAALERNSLADKRTVARLLGYGEPDLDRVLEGNAQRVTLFGWGDLSRDFAHRFSLPLPDCLRAIAVWKRLTVTLAWLSPINPAHKDYRKAKLWFEPYGGNKSDSAMHVLSVSRDQAQWQATRRGTVQHEILTGALAAPFVTNQNLEIQVNCGERAGRLSVSVPYGLAVTLEVKEGINLPVYEQVKDRVKAITAVPVQPI